MFAEQIKDDPFDEALRYIENAQTILRKNARKRGNFYSDPKFVRMACNTAWNGVLEAVKAKMAYDGIQIDSKKRKNVDIYRDYLARKNKTILKSFNSAYTYLHLSGGYDGDLNVTTSQEGIRLALEIIDWCKKNSNSKNK